MKGYGRVCMGELRELAIALGIGEGWDNGKLAVNIDSITAEESSAQLGVNFFTNVG